MRRMLFTLLSAVALMATGVVGAIAVGGTGTVEPPPRIAFLANGRVPADALAAGGIAGQLGAPLFTTEQAALSDAARAGLAAYGPELLIVLGGPVAIEDDVLIAAAGATGLSVVTDADARPDEGAIRVAGADRFATAAAVAELLGDYDVAFLPAAATAQGAVDADMVDGLDADAFALANQSCAAGQVVTGIDADGTPTCAGDAVDGGDADTIDGLDADDLLQVAPFTVAANSFAVGGGSTNTGTVGYFSNTMQLTADGAGDFFVATTDIPVGLGGFERAELLDITLCVGTGATNLDNLLLRVRQYPGGIGPLFETFPLALANDTCETFVPSATLVVDGSSRIYSSLTVDPNLTVDVDSYRIRFAATDAPLTTARSASSDDGPQSSDALGGS